MLGIGTGEFIMVCNSDSFRGCEGLGAGCWGVGGPSVGFAIVLDGTAEGVEGCDAVWLLTDCLRTSALLLGGCDDMRRSLTV